LLYILHIYIFVLTALSEEVLASAYQKQMTIEEELKEKRSKLDEINVQYNKLRILLEQKQQSRSRRNNAPTTFETINTFNSSMRYRRRNETKDILEFIHGGLDGAIYGAWDFIASVVSSSVLDKLISTYKRGKYLQGVFGRALDNYKNSEEALKQATANKYQNFLSRRKFNFICKTQSSYFDPEKELWVPRNVKFMGVDIKLMRQISDTAVDKFVKSMNIGYVCQIPNVSGLCRTVTGLIFMILDLHLRLPYLRKKLVWFNGNTYHFVFQFSDDGAPETSQLSMSIGSLTCWNFWERVRSRDYHYILHCLSISEKDQIMSDLWTQISQEMLMLEGNVLTVCNEQCSVEFQPSSDQSWQSWASNELNQAATYPSPYANVHKSDLSKMGGTIGFSKSDTWSPYTMETRKSAIEKVNKHMNSLSNTISESTKHKKMLDFMADNGIRQVGPPRIGVYADLQKPEPLHIEINAWQHYLDLMYHEAVQRQMIDLFLETLAAPTTGKTVKTARNTGVCAITSTCDAQMLGVGERVSNIPLVQQQASNLEVQFQDPDKGKDVCNARDSIILGCGLSFVAKKVKEHYSDDSKRHNKLPLRLIGHQAILLAQYSYRLVDSLVAANESQGQYIRRQALTKIGEYLRDAGTLFNKLETNTSELDLLKELCTMYFNLNSLFFSHSLNVTVWTVGYALPYHAVLLYSKYKCGYGIISLQAKESKHAAIKQDLSLTNRSTAADISGKWGQVMRANYVRTFYLPEHNPLPSTYTSHYQSRLPPHSVENSSCHCGRTIDNENEDKCNMCIDSEDIVICAKQKKILPTILKILKRFPDKHLLKEHIQKVHQQNVRQDIVPQNMTAHQLKHELRLRGLSTTGNKSILIQRLEGNL